MNCFNDSLANEPHAHHEGSTHTLALCPTYAYEKIVRVSLLSMQNNEAAEGKKKKVLWNG